MRTNVMIDSKLVAETQKATGIQTKQGVVEEALRFLLRMRKQEAVRKWRGRLRWEDDLEAMRRDKGR